MGAGAYTCGMIDLVARKTCPGLAEACEHLSRVEPRLAAVIQHVGPCTLAPRTDYFSSLCQAIVTQQISTKVAMVIFRRFRQLFPQSRPTPPLLVKMPEEALRSVGLSRQKISYLRSLAEAFAAGQVPVRKFRAMTDEQIIDALVPLRGIGRWTAEMFLMFVLNRPDVLPVDDLGLRKGYQVLFKLKELPDARVLVRRTEHWRPYRSVATWYLWRMPAPWPPSSAGIEVP
jgi:3-methyladenine DNA glycosylase/8-oxoguanine DNA glycosylase